MQTLKEQYEDMSPDRLRDLLSNAVLEPDARLLCEQVLSNKLGIKKLEHEAHHTTPEASLSAKGPINNFLVKQEVDVSRSFAVIVIASTIAQAITDYREFLLAGNISVNLAIPLGLILAIGLWKRRSWARRVVLTCSWLAFGVYFLFMSSVLELGISPVTFSNIGLEVDGRTVENASRFAIFAAQLIYLPVIWILLLVAHSRKYKDETAAGNVRQIREEDH